MPDSERRAMVGRALAMARRVGDPVALASVLTAHSWIVAGPESLPERLALADELVAVGREAGLPYAECDGHHMRFLALVELGDMEAADDTLAAARSAGANRQGAAGPSPSSTRRGRCSPVDWKTQRRKPCGPARSSAPRRLAAFGRRVPVRQAAVVASAWSRDA